MTQRLNRMKSRILLIAGESTNACLLALLTDQPPPQNLSCDSAAGFGEALSR